MFKYHVSKNPNVYPLRHHCLKNKPFHFAKLKSPFLASLLQTHVKFVNFQIQCISHLYSKNGKKKENINTE